MIDVITMSSKGQFVIPVDIRKEMGLKTFDKFVIIGEKDSILLKRIKKDDNKREMKMLLDKLSDEFEKAGIKGKDIEEEIKKARKR